MKTTNESEPESSAPASAAAPPEILRTSEGEFPLREYNLRAAGREWKALHVDAALSHSDESAILGELMKKLPYGVVLWPAAVALAHDVASRADRFRGGARVLELGAGAGLPGIVAASLGARVVQTDRNALAMSLCRRNAERNGVETIDRRLADWTEWEDRERYDWILGSDLLYAPEMHPYLRRIFETNLAPGGRVLLSDPFRQDSLPLLEQMDGDGWDVTLSKWTVGEDETPRSIAVYEAARAR